MLPGDTTSVAAARASAGTRYRSPGLAELDGLQLRRELGRVSPFACGSLNAGADTLLPSLHAGAGGIVPSAAPLSRAGSSTLNISSARRHSRSCGLVRAIVVGSTVFNHPPPQKSGAPGMWVVPRTLSAL